MNLTQNSDRWRSKYRCHYRSSQLENGPKWACSAPLPLGGLPIVGTRPRGDGESEGRSAPRELVPEALGRVCSPSSPTFANQECPLASRVE